MAATSARDRAWRRAFTTPPGVSLDVVEDTGELTDDLEVLRGEAVWVIDFLAAGARI